MSTPKGKVRRYPRLAIRRRSLSQLVEVTATHREFRLVPRYAVYYVSSPSTERLIYAGQDDGVIGWVNCVDFVQATIKQAQR